MTSTNERLLELIVFLWGLEWGRLLVYKGGPNQLFVYNLFMSEKVDCINVGIRCAYALLQLNNSITNQNF